MKTILWRAYWAAHYQVYINGQNIQRYLRVMEYIDARIKRQGNVF